MAKEALMKRTLSTLVGVALVVAAVVAASAYLIRSQWTPAFVAVYFNKAGDDLRAELTNLIRTSSGRIEVALYAFTDTELARALKDAADANREIRVVLGSQGGGDAAEEAIARDLVGTRGVQLRRVSNVHHDFAVLGGDLVITGSTNWTPPCLDSAANNLVVINSSGTADAYRNEFERLWTSKP
jgi:phosphatidylserine/phosphatidylglycerophosphate/cardiolipin synthase-like enzyme